MRACELIKPDTGTTSSTLPKKKEAEASGGYVPANSKTYERIQVGFPVH